MDRRYSGIAAALVTPYTKSGDVHYAELKRLVRYLIGQGIDGFYVCGSTAEAFLLTQEERKNILEAVVEETAGEKYVIAHVGQISTDLAVDLALHAKSAGADAVSAISPFYYKFSVNEIKSYYFDIMEQSDMPMFIYNFPNFSGFNLTSDLLDLFCENSRVAGVKFTSSDFFQMERMKTNHPELAIWNGYDEMLLSGLAAGADGGIGSTYNCMCPLIRGIYDSQRAGDFAAAQRYQQRANGMIELICKHGVFASVKALLEQEGFTFNGCRKPFAPITDEGREELRAAYSRYVVQEGAVSL